MTAPREHTPDDGAQARAVAFEELFRLVYLRFHRRDSKRSELTGASRAVLEHLAHTGPLTVGEMARHLDRAQSVVSDIVTQLCGHGLLERRSDLTDRRRTLVWLTDSGHAALEVDRQVLSQPLLANAFARLDDDRTQPLLAGLRALLDAGPTPGFGQPAQDRTPTPSTDLSTDVSTDHHQPDEESR